jgi:CheY-like chemotaxis protein
MIAAQDHDRAKANIGRVLKGDKPESTEYMARRKDGGTFPVMIYSTRIVRDGGVAGMRGIIVDLSEHKAAEIALKESEERLRQSQKMEAIGRLAGGIAHDFNNLLTTILGYSEMLLSEGTATKEALESVREISKSAQRAASLTQQLLAYSRKQVLRPEVVPGEYVMLAVTDTGCGIDEKIQKQIFEPFFTTKEPGKGTGLGLATVFGTVKQSNGYVYVYSEPELGSTFKIYLPVIQTRKPKGRDHPKEWAGYTTDRTILLVEDDEPLRKLVSQILNRTGYTVVSASNGEEALRLIDSPEHTGIDLLVSDVVMPGIGGKALAEKLEARLPDLKVLFISGYPDEAVVHHGVLDEGVAYLQKPFSPKAIIQKVQEVLAEE